MIVTGIGHKTTLKLKKQEYKKWLVKFTEIGLKEYIEEQDIRHSSIVYLTKDAEKEMEVFKEE